MTFSRIAAACAAACCFFAAIAHADDAVYLGKSTVQSAGAYPASCLPREMRIAVTGDHFAAGSGNITVASGPIAPDGGFSARYTIGTGVGAAQIDIKGRLAGTQITGTTSSSSGCVLSFTLTKS